MLRLFLKVRARTTAVPPFQVAAAYAGLRFGFRRPFAIPGLRPGTARKRRRPEGRFLWRFYLCLQFQKLDFSLSLPIRSKRNLAPVFFSAAEPGGVPLAEAWNAAPLCRIRRACRAAVHRCGSPQIFRGLWKSRSAFGCLAARGGKFDPQNRTYVRVCGIIIPPISSDVKGVWGKNTNTVPKTGHIKASASMERRTLSFYRNQKYCLMPSGARSGSSLMVMVNLMPFFSPKLLSQFRKSSTSL